MTKFSRALLITEFVIAFAPAVILLGLGIISAPLFAYQAYNGQYENVLLVPMTVFGFLGFWGAVGLLTLTLDGKSKKVGPNRLKIYIICGVVSCVCAVIYFSIMSLMTLFLSVLPLLVTLHLVVLQREYLLSGTNLQTLQDSL